MDFMENVMFIDKFMVFIFLLTFSLKFALKVCIFFLTLYPPFGPLLTPPHGGSTLLEQSESPFLNDYHCQIIFCLVEDSVGDN